MHFSHKALRLYFKTEAILGLVLANLTLLQVVAYLPSLAQLNMLTFMHTPGQTLQIPHYTAVPDSNSSGTHLQRLIHNRTSTRF